MARIRSIKPDFWCSEQVIGLSRDARLLFIGLWNFADDKGRIKWSPLTIKAQIFPADNLSGDDVENLLSEIVRGSLLERYENGSQMYAQITGWHHQRIDRPQPAKYPGLLDSGSILVPFGERSENDLGTFAPDRIGSDRIGKEGIGKEDCEGVQATPAPPVAAPLEPPPSSPKLARRKPAKTPSASTSTWNLYARAYEARYGVEPVRNARTNGQMAQVVQRLPAADAPHVAEHFLRSQYARYVAAGHPVGMLLQDAEKLHTEWRTGRSATAHEARRRDEQSAKGQMFEALANRLDAEDAQKMQVKP